jgi:hypothetical protein
MRWKNGIRVVFMMNLFMWSIAVEAGEEDLELLDTGTILAPYAIDL